jgi:phosphoglycolate phosphatase
MRPAIGLGARMMIKTALGFHGREALADDLERMIEVFLTYYAEHIAVDSRPYPGFLEAAAVLKAAGARLGVCTNKRAENAQRLLEALELDALFGVIAGRDTFPVCKPHPGHVLGTIACLSGDPARAIMIGDSTADAEAARAAKVPFICVTFGYGPDATEMADAVISDYGNLIPTVERLLLRMQIGKRSPEGR